MSVRTAACLSGGLSRRRAQFHFGTGPEAFVGATGRVRAVLTTTGSSFEADLVVAGTPPMASSVRGLRSLEMAFMFVMLWLIKVRISLDLGLAKAYLPVCVR